MAGETRAVVEAGADINARTKKGVTALVIASEMGHPEVIKLLIEQGADVNAHTKEGHTALMGASAMGHPDVAQLLIEAGAKKLLNQGRN